MIVQGTHSFDAPPEVVWDLLLDPAVMAKAMPGTRELILVEPDHYRGRMQVSVGPITAAEFALDLRLTEVDPPRRFVMSVEGNGRFGFTRGRGGAELVPENGGTRMSYQADLQVGGKIASVGQRLLDMVGRSMLRSGLEALGKELKRRLAEDR